MIDSFVFGGLSERAAGESRGGNVNMQDVSSVNYWMQC